MHNNIKNNNNFSNKIKCIYNNYKTRVKYCNSNKLHHQKVFNKDKQIYFQN